MRLVLSREKPAFDHELVWFSVFLASAAGGAAWLWSGLPLPGCPLRTLTGIPCLTCGGTRAARHLLHGEPWQAFLQSPLVTSALLLCGLYMLYAACVLFFRSPRIRIADVTPHEARMLRGAALFLILAGWTYLIVTGAASSR
jgi:hypothetical protein